ncbi:CmcJ/NvfI family oxidoreductase [Novosphingobium bradum]|uniref:CmcJ/NvfI family oxidoreductase n=1 Tax=Novosphingobium bradum TaxID=1737444 RepID=A0ABV7IM50_9SPHN
MNQSPLPEPGLQPGIAAQVPYLRSDLDRLHVEYAARILGADLIDCRPCWIRDGRANPPSLDAEGFALTACPSRVIAERGDDLRGARLGPEALKAVQRAYWDQTIPHILAISGAREVVPVHAASVRYSQRTGQQQVMTPAGWVHIDYDPQEAEVQLRETLELNGCTPAPFSRYVLYQGWRALSPPPQDFPLALCDGRTVSPQDAVPIDYHMEAGGRDVTYRSTGIRHNADHQWWYFPDMTIDEMILFKGFDSALGDRLKVIHVAIEDTSRPEAVPRISLESRYFALFD